VIQPLTNESALKTVLCAYVCIKVKLSQCLTNYGLHHEDLWGNRCIDPRFIGLCTNWRWVASFTPRPQYSRRKSPWYPLDRRLGAGWVLEPAWTTFLLFPFWLPLEYRASMKLSVSLQCLNLGQSVGLLGGVISSSQDLYLHRTTQT
jgi:hypothetical protein